MRGRASLVLVPVALVAALALVAACSPDPPAGPSGDGTVVDPGATPSPSAPADPSTTPAATPTGPVFSVDGTGPYQLGLTLDALQAGGALADVTMSEAVCTQNTVARGTGEFSDVRMSFRPDGGLYLITNRSADIPTPSGARIGTTLAALTGLYTDATTETLAPSAFLVRAGSAGRGILFDLDDSDRVFTMSAADADYLKSSYLNGTDFC
jgi:hypothetical protein